MMTEAQGNGRLKSVLSGFNSERFNVLHETISFQEYLDRCYNQPNLVRTAYQRLYDLIMEAGTETYTRYRQTMVHYKFFDHPEVPVFGLDPTLMQLVAFVKGAAGGYGTEKRLLLLRGPVGSAKSTICRRIKKGLEEYTRTEDGAIYTYRWKNLPTGENGIYTHTEDLCPMHDDPLALLPMDIRKQIVTDLNKIRFERLPAELRNASYKLRPSGDVNPRSRKFMKELLLRTNGDLETIFRDHIEVVRLQFSETDRVGIGTFAPKDEKNQDSTELTGDINFAKLTYFGADSDPRAFEYDGEFCVAHRGACEFIEVFKLAKEFLYDLLHATQERVIKPKKGPQIPIDTVLIGHTNSPEYDKVRADQTMEALQDRTVRIDVPYLLRLTDEIDVLMQDYGPGKVEKHIAPHTIKVAALFAILTRLENDNDNKLKLIDKAKLYDGQPLNGWTEDRVKELRDKSTKEGLDYGLSARFVQEKISNCLASDRAYINPFMVLNELKKGLRSSSLLSDQDEIARYEDCEQIARQELDEILKNEVRRALIGDETALQRLCANYIDNLMAYINKTKVRNPYTGQEQSPDEGLMRSIEEKIDVPELGAQDFRRMIAERMASISHEGKTFKWNSETRLADALERKLFEEVQDSIKLSALHQSGASVVDPDLQEKIDALKQRLIKNHGYIEESAQDVLNYVGSIFARGEIVNKG